MKNIMARRMAVVPTSWVENMKKNKMKENVINNEVTIMKETTKQHLIHVDMFPKNLRAKAKLMLDNLNNLNLDDNNRVIYDNGGIGSNIFDLIKYFISDINFSPARPLDSEEFEKLLTSVPEAAFGRGRRSVNNKKWKTLY